MLYCCLCVLLFHFYLALFAPVRKDLFYMLNKYGSCITDSVCPIYISTLQRLKPTTCTKSLSLDIHVLASSSTLQRLRQWNSDPMGFFCVQVQILARFLLFFFRLIRRILYEHLARASMWWNERCKYRSKYKFKSNTFARVRFWGKKKCLLGI